jgi:hypothetical protein
MVRNGNKPEEISDTHTTRHSAHTVRKKKRNNMSCFINHNATKIGSPISDANT